MIKLSGKISIKSNSFCSQNRNHLPDSYEVRKGNDSAMIHLTVLHVALFLII